MISIDNNIKFNISEIFYSIQGESTHAGERCVFVRLQGCELRCNWCDTPYALDINEKIKLMTADEIVNAIKKYDCNFITFTGGEPLLQNGIADLINHLAGKNYKVSVETNGHQDISYLHPSVIKIMDLKAPGSGMEKYNFFENLKYLTDKDDVKIAISDRNDYEWSKKIIYKKKLHKLINSVILTPVFGEQNPEELAEWILQDNLPARMLLQMHKFIWGSDRRGV